MNVPPFPSQDLAKLVLGYLAEEQLMTAYDEFLSASPYLDAQRNEYDRIFMTSLKNILAEYRAVKIYLETCKPYALRRRLFGCTNLLEIVKFLVQNVDVSKLHVPDGNRASLDARSIMCAVCHSQKLPSCVCKGHPSSSLTNSQSNVEDGTHETSVEATLLEDLPGNHVTTKKKQVKTLNKQYKPSQHVSSDSHIDVENSFSPNFHQALPNYSQNQPTRLQANSVGLNSNSVLDKLNTVHTLTQIYANSSNSMVYNRSNINCPTNVPHRVSKAGTFQDFTSGVRGTENINSNVPDSSTSENVNTQSILCKDIVGMPTRNSNANLTSKSHMFLTVGTFKTSTAPAPATDDSNGIQPTSSNTAKQLPKPYNESKVTILSDIKVDKAFNNDNMPVVLKNATSSPLMHMQTILINGTPVYKPQPQAMRTNNRNFTKDEIMAMPTIIVVPTSGGSQMPANNQTEEPSQLSNPPPSTISSTAQPLEPLMIDISSDSPTLAPNTNIPNNSNMPLLDQPKDSKTEMLVKTVSTAVVSAPRACSPGARNTPQGPPPARKSSSTPRRTSHVRVLDFATPRRILQETIRENVAENDNSPLEVVISRSPNLHTLADSTDAQHTFDKTDDKTKKADSTANSSGSSKENDKSIKNVPTKKTNWDADLRAVAITNKKEDIPKSNIQPRCRPKPKTNKNKLSLGDKKNKGKSVCQCAEENVNKTNNSNKKKKSNPVIEDPIIVVDDNSNVPIKPTINIITGQDWSIQENDKNHNNKTNINDPSDTPDMDRLSLQNAIGAKLNISDLLGTPYKQVLYDIQMETPRFLGPDLPDVPMSDIKIMNIPTPRFLDTPKPLQATPSSYSSRPTDYSSGGSYYKPDDQDSIPLGDLGYPVTVPKEKEISDVANADRSEKENNSKQKSGRPVRQCAKNVSYYDSPMVNKPKETCDKTDKTSICSDTLSINSLAENKVENVPASKSGKESKQKKNKAKRNSTSKKHKSPIKRETPKTFMKIKPRRVTPTKESLKGKVRAKMSPKKRITSKEKTSATPVVVSNPTKSRRKSSTPRKLHCTKNYNTESSGHDSPEIASKAKEDIIKEARLLSVPDSDTEQVPLHWSDDGSQDAKPNEQQACIPTNDTEDIMKIKEYIASECVNVAIKSNDHCSNLHADLIKRGFDTETAKIIERDLLDSPADTEETNLTRLPSVATQTNKDEVELEKTLEADTSAVLKIAPEEEEDCEEIELTESECYEGSDNFITCNHEDLEYIPRAPAMRLKDKFSMEVCIDDEVTVRLRATPATTLLDQDPDEFTVYNEKETEMAVSSIANIDKLYTPMKDSDIRAQVYDIFESTLTSLDTPLKAHSPKRRECEAAVTEIILEVEKVEDKEKPDEKKRKRLHSAESTDSDASSKRAKPDPHYLLHSTNIQNIDIESVLSKLHGP